MEQGEMSLQEALEAVIAEDKQLLSKQDELIKALEGLGERLSWQEFRRLKNVLDEANVGEILLAADQKTQEEKDAAIEKVVKGLPNAGEERAREICAAITGALHWGEEEAPEEAEEMTDSAEAVGEGAADAAAETAAEAVTEEAVQETPAGWDCVCGRKNNKGKFCSGCGMPQGTAAAEQSSDAGWTCQSCGRQGNKGKFCGGCGTPKGETKPAESPVVSLEKPAATVQEIFDKVREEKAPVQTAVPEPMTPPVIPKRTMQPKNTAADSGSHGTQRLIIGVILFLVCVLAGICFKEFSAGTDTSASSSYHSLAQKSDSSKEKKKSQPTAKSELSLGGVDLDISLDELHSKLGKEKSVENGKEGHTFYIYDNMKVGARNGVVTSFVSNGADCSTKRGIHEGSSLQEVLDAYGSDAMKTNYEGLVLYEYNFKSLAGNDGILRFAINGQNKVDYISVRIPEEPKVDTQAAGNAAKNAVASYHNYITQRNYQAAYNLLTSDMQNTMGAYGNWASGFANTIESRVTDMQVSSVQADQAEISFILVARDRRPGGGYEENRFRSTATVVNEGGTWKIAAVNNKKI